MQNLTSRAFQKRHLLPYAQGGHFRRIEWREPSNDEGSEDDEYEGIVESSAAGKDRNVIDEGLKKGSDENSKNEDAKQEEKGKMVSYTCHIKLIISPVAANKIEPPNSSGPHPFQHEGGTSDRATNSRAGSVGSRSDTETWKDFETLYISEETDFSNREVVDYASDSSRPDWGEDSSEAVSFGEVPDTGLMACRQYRYEVTHWVYHLREAQALWSAEEQQKNADWTYVWDQLLKFTRKQHRAFQAWLRLLCYHDGSIPYAQICQGNPLHIASYLGLSSFIRKLIADGYDVHQQCLHKTKFGKKDPRKYFFPLDLAVSNNSVDVETVKLLVDHGADLNRSNQYLGGEFGRQCNPFHLMVRKQPSRDFIEYLLAHGADPSVKDGKARTAVHQFSYAGLDPEALHLLLKAQPDVNLINLVSTQHQTPLHLLVERKNDLPLGLLKAYLEAKADVNIEDKKSMSMSTTDYPSLIATKVTRTSSQACIVRQRASC